MPHTQKTVQALTRPLTRAQTYWDADPKAKGFGVGVYSSGAKSFFINYRLDGVEKRYTIGAFPVWTVEAGRERARELRRQIDKGHDPAGEKRERRETATIQDLIDHYETEHLPIKRTKLRKHAYLEQLAHYRETDEKQMLAEIGARLGMHTKVADIHGGDIRAMHRAITAEGRPIRANRILAVASRMFSLSLVPRAGENHPWRNAVDGNPCKGVQKTTKSRGRGSSAKPSSRGSATPWRRTAGGQGFPDMHTLSQVDGDKSGCDRVIV